MDKLKMDKLKMDKLKIYKIFNTIYTKLQCKDFCLVTML